MVYEVVQLFEATKRILNCDQADERFRAVQDTMRVFNVSFGSDHEFRV